MEGGKEHKLAAARLKLKQYRSKKTKVTDGLVASNPDSQTSTAFSSRASSCEPLNHLEGLDQPTEDALTDSYEVIDPPSQGNSVLEHNATISFQNINSESQSTEIKLASAMFASSSNSAVNDFLTHSVAYAIGEHSAPLAQNASLESSSNTANKYSNVFSTPMSTSHLQQEPPSPAQYSVSNSQSIPSSGYSYGVPAAEDHSSPQHSDPHKRDSSVESVKTEVAGSFSKYDSLENQSPPQQSTVENLKQISMQLEGLVNEAEGDPGKIGDPQQALVRSLEERNSVLAQQLQEQQVVSAQQQQQLQQLSLMLHEAQKKEQQNSVETEGTPASEELNHVRQQLHIHVQTVGILIAEKTQLESNVADLKHSLKSFEDQATEMEGRLAASRHRVEELEAVVKSKENELSNLSLEKERLESQVTLAQEEKERYKLRCNDNELRVAELGERVRTSGKDQQSLQDQLSETKTQLHMANIRIEQLRNSSGDAANILDELNSEKKAHQATQEELCEAKQMLSQVEVSKKKEMAEYQLFTQQISVQVEQLKGELQETEAQKQASAERISKLEEEIQHLQLQLSKVQTSASGAEVKEAEMKQMREAVEQLKKRLQESEEAKRQLEQDNLSLSRLSEEQREKMEHLELSLDRRQTEAVDSSGLMARLQSDKVAAARALTQNKMLKDQLAELQDGFIMMSNKKLELTEKLEREFHIKKGLHKQLSELTEQEAKHKEADAVREREVEQLRESCSSLASQLSAIKQKYREQQQWEVKPQQGEDKQLTNQQGVATNQQGVATNQQGVATNQQGVTTNQQGVTTNQQGVTTNQQGVTTNQHEEAAPQNADVAPQNAEAAPQQEGVAHPQPNVTNHDDGTALNVTTSSDSSTGSSTLSTSDSSSCADNIPGDSKHCFSEVSLVHPNSSYRYILEHMRPGDLESTSMAEVLERLNRAGAPAGRAALLEYRLAQLSSTYSALVARFQKAMAQVAQLNEEKQNLEVTVEQLELENDTIGDYITIYQFKRGVLSQQMREKDLELDRLRGDKQTLVDKLSKLQELVLALSRESGDSLDASQLLSGVNSLISDTTENTEASPLTNGTEEETNSSQTTLSKPLPTKAEGVPKQARESQTVSKILELIKEMGEQPSSDSAHLQPCGLCQGSLITV